MGQVLQQEDDKPKHMENLKVNRKPSMNDFEQEQHYENLFSFIITLRLLQAKYRMAATGQSQC